MYTGNVTDKQSISVIVMYITGTSSLVIFALEAKKDLWLGILICYAMTVLMSLMIGRIKRLFPDMDIFQIFEVCFGKIISKLINAVYIISAFYVVVLINTFLIHFIRITALPTTPNPFLAVFITFICIWMVKEGVELISRFSAMFLLPTLISIILLVVMLIPQMNFGNLLPAFQEGIFDILYGSLSAFIFPLGEIVVFSAFFQKFSTPKASYKVFLTGSAIGALVVFSISVSNVMVLGINLASDVYYPTYLSASRISVGTYLHGLELILSIVFILGAFVKSAVYFSVCCKAIARSFGLDSDYKFIVTPVGLLLYCSSLFFYKGAPDYTEWLKKALVPYSIPYIIIIPIITFIVVEFRKKKFSQLRQ
ncbi:spore germination protein KB [Anaerobacterium chartisolvens]|uniref:Spore germination protein KB n=1 Tax=Anaerobacterium chartisolvens TaxID=1297424 RepID=A0A369AVA8_9FIRM|nr:endospore germination permease [Anaerobacterium chartisolvens]RCX13003.1 spore germination protein KB [Anaerobacterium chartisolvens]